LRGQGWKVTEHCPLANQVMWGRMVTQLGDGHLSAFDGQRLPLFALTPPRCTEGVLDVEGPLGHWGLSGLMQRVPLRPNKPCQ
jgi:hypothetical protein